MKPIFNAVGLLLFMAVAAACSPQGDGSNPESTADPLGSAATDESMDAPEPMPVSYGPLPIDTESERARELYVEGEYLMDVGRGVQARDKFLQAIEEDSGFVRAYWGVSNVALSFNEFQEILDKAGEYLEGASESDRALIEANRSFLTNSPATGEKIAARLAAGYPVSPRAQIYLAGFQTAQNKSHEARESLSLAIELDPQSAGAFYGLATNYLFSEPKDFSKAEKIVMRFNTLYPDEAKGFELLGDIHRAQGNLEGALAAYQRAGEIDPTFELAQHKQGHINSFLGNIQEARSAYDAAIELAPPESKAGYVVYKCFTRIHEGDISAAIDELEALADGVADLGTPDDQIKGFQVFALTNAAQAGLHAGMFDRAADLIQRRNALNLAIAEDVGTDDARRLQRANNLQWDGLLAAFQGNAEAARGAAGEFESIVANDDNPRKMEPAHWVLGVLALTTGEYAAAVEELRQADHANNIYIRYQFAEALSGAGQAGEARALYQQVADFNFNSVGFALIGDEARDKASKG